MALCAVYHLWLLWFCTQLSLEQVYEMERKYNRGREYEDYY